MKRHICVFALFLSVATGVHAQSVPQSPRGPFRFEVTSVRPNKSGPGSTSMRRLPGSFTATNVTLRDLILFAYGIQRYRLLGMPGWAQDERFDIAAKAGAEPITQPPTGPPVELLMQRTLLEERFGLAVHFETREMPIYALVLARADGRLGLQLTQSLTKCYAVTQGAPAPVGQPACSARSGNGFTTAVGFPMSSFPDYLAGQVQRTVVDRTGLTGTWDLELTFTPDGFAGQTPAQDTTGPSLFTALQEQLGLKLEASTGPVEVLVIDRAQRPTAN
jgi:uncharacterized protein (TIGR03435 family)